MPDYEELQIAVSITGVDEVSAQIKLLKGELRGLGEGPKTEGDLISKGLERIGKQLEAGFDVLERGPEAFAKFARGFGGMGIAVGAFAGVLAGAIKMVDDFIGKQRTLSQMARMGPLDEAELKASADGLKRLGLTLQDVAEINRELADSLTDLAFPFSKIREEFMKGSRENLPFWMRMLGQLQQDQQGGKGIKALNDMLDYLDQYAETLKPTIRAHKVQEVTQAMHMPALARLVGTGFRFREPSDEQRAEQARKSAEAERMGKIMDDLEIQAVRIRNSFLMIFGPPLTEALGSFADALDDVADALDRLNQQSTEGKQNRPMQGLGALPGTKQAAELATQEQLPQWMPQWMKNLIYPQQGAPALGGIAKESAKRAINPAYGGWRAWQALKTLGQGGAAQPFFFGGNSEATGGATMADITRPDIGPNIQPVGTDKQWVDAIMLLWGIYGMGAASWLGSAYRGIGLGSAGGIPKVPSLQPATGEPQRFGGTSLDLDRAQTSQLRQVNAQLRELNRTLEGLFLPRGAGGTGGQRFGGGGSAGGGGASGRVGGGGAGAEQSATTPPSGGGGGSGTTAPHTGSSAEPPKADQNVPPPGGTAMRDPISATGLGGGVGDPRAGHTHQGIDILAPHGSPIYSTGEGVIERHNPTGSFQGDAVTIIRHPDGTRSVYMHHSLAEGLKTGDSVKAGQVIGKSGTANRVPHLHFERWKGYPWAQGSTRYNPETEFGWQRGKGGHLPSGGQPAWVGGKPPAAPDTPKAEAAEPSKFAASGGGAAESTNAITSAFSRTNWGKFESEARPSTNIEDARTGAGPAAAPIGGGGGGGGGGGLADLLQGGGGASGLVEHALGRLGGLGGLGAARRAIDQLSAILPGITRGKANINVHMPFGLGGHGGALPDAGMGSLFKNVTMERMTQLMPTSHELPHSPNPTRIGGFV